MEAKKVNEEGTPKKRNCPAHPEPVDERLNYEEQVAYPSQRIPQYSVLQSHLVVFDDIGLPTDVVIAKKGWVLVSATNPAKAKVAILTNNSLHEVGVENLQTTFWTGVNPYRHMLSFVCFYQLGLKESFKVCLAAVTKMVGPLARCAGILLAL